MILKCKGFVEMDNGQEIKVGCEKYTGNWVEGFPMIDTDNSYIGNDEIIPETLSLTTNIKDVKGREIFENDVVRMTYDGLNLVYIGIVKTKNQCLGIEWSNSITFVQKTGDVKEWRKIFTPLSNISKSIFLEIIGNIFEMPLYEACVFVEMTDCSINTVYLDMSCYVLEELPCKKNLKELIDSQAGFDTKNCYVNMQITKDGEYLEGEEYWIKNGELEV